MNATLLLKVSSVLWVIWGLVHLLAGVITMSMDTVSAILGIADGISPEVLADSYAGAVGAIINQHGWNLAWIGIATTVGAVYVWKQSVLAIFITAIVGGLADIGYFIFLDLGGYVNFVPGTVMTIISSGAIILSFAGLFLLDKRKA